MGASAALWRRSDMAGSGALWGDLDLNWKQDLEPPERQLSLAAWLGRRTAGLRRLRLDGPLPHLGQLLRAVSGSGLRGLVLEDQAFADGALAHLPRLPSLTRLVLSSCQLRGVPPSLTALATNLRDLDVGSNWLQLEGGEGGEGVWAPLSHLQALTRLNASYCGGHCGGLVGLAAGKLEPHAAAAPPSSSLFRQAFTMCHGAAACSCLTSPPHSPRRPRGRAAARVGPHAAARARLGGEQRPLAGRAGRRLV